MDTRSENDLLRAEIERLNVRCEIYRAAFVDNVNAANALVQRINKWGSRTAGQTLPTELSDALFDFELGFQRFIYRDLP